MPLSYLSLSYPRISYGVIRYITVYNGIQPSHFHAFLMIFLNNYESIPALTNVCMHACMHRPDVAKHFVHWDSLGALRCLNPKHVFEHFGPWDSPGSSEVAVFEHFGPWDSPGSPEVA